MKFDISHIKRGDLVQVITGDDKGKTGKVIHVYPKRERVLVEKLNMVKRHMKPNQQYKQGGVIEKEASIQWSNVMVVCSKCNKPVKIKRKLISKEMKRTCAKCGELVEAAAK